MQVRGDTSRIYALGGSFIYVTKQEFSCIINSKMLHMIASPVFGFLVDNPASGIYNPLHHITPE